MAYNYQTCELCDQLRQSNELHRINIQEYDNYGPYRVCPTCLQVHFKKVYSQKDQREIFNQTNILLFYAAPASAKTVTLENCLMRSYDPERLRSIGPAADYVFGFCESPAPGGKYFLQFDPHRPSIEPFTFAAGDVEKCISTAFAMLVECFQPGEIHCYSFRYAPRSSWARAERRRLDVILEEYQGKRAKLNE